MVAATKAPTLPRLFKPGSQQAPQSLCIYGRSGVGKTTLVGTMPGKGLVIDVPQIEGGTFVLADKADTIDVVPVETWDEIDEIYWYLAREKHEYQWVALDSITAFQVLAKRKIIKERHLAEAPHKIALQEYGQIGQLCGELIYRFNTLKMHTIWLAQERKFTTDDDEGNQESTIGPDVLPGTLGALMPPLLLTGRLYIAETLNGWERRLRIGQHAKFFAKYRSRPGNDVPDVIRNVNLGETIRYLTKGGAPLDGVKEDEVELLVVE